MSTNGSPGESSGTSDEVQHLSRALQAAARRIDADVAARLTSELSVTAGSAIAECGLDDLRLTETDADADHPIVVAVARYLVQHRAAPCSSEVLLLHGTTSQEQEISAEPCGGLLLSGTGNNDLDDVLRRAVDLVYLLGGGDRADLLWNEAVSLVCFRVWLLITKAWDAGDAERLAQYASPQYLKAALRNEFHQVRRADEQKKARFGVAVAR